MARFRSHEDSCRQIAEELAAGQRDDRLWLESYVQEQGNEALARQRYIRMRADRLQWLANGPGSETNEVLPRMGLPPRQPKTLPTAVGTVANPVREASSQDVHPTPNHDRAGSEMQVEGAPREDQPTSSSLWTHVSRWTGLGSATLLLLVVIAAAFLRPGRIVDAPATAARPGPTTETGLPAARLDAGLQASSAQQAALARRLLGKWECVPRQVSPQGEKFRYFYEYLPSERLRFLGAESRWLVAPNLHVLEDASGPEASRADGMMEYKLDWESDDRYVRTEVNFRSSAICSRARGG